MPNLLLLHPNDPLATPSPEPLTEALQRLGLLGEPFTFEGAPHYRPGERFLQLITYLGCSPVIALGSPGATGDDFAHLALVGPLEIPRFEAGINAKVPRCPACRARLEEGWQDLVASLVAGECLQRSCPSCGKEHFAAELDWRQCAAYARTMLAIWGVFEGEAVPSDDLLNVLREHGGAWRWSYVRR